MTKKPAASGSDQPAPQDGGAGKRAASLPKRPDGQAMPLVLREAFDLSPDLIFVADAEGRLVWVNSAFDYLSGLDRLEYVGQSFPKLIAPGDSRKLSAYFIRQKHKRTNMSLADIPLNAAENKHPRVALRVRYVEDRPGEGLFVGVGRAIGTPGANPETLRPRVSEIAAQIAEARAGTVVRNEFLEAMSGEVRAPMDTVMSMVQLLLETTLDDEQKRLMGVVRSSAQSLLNLINDMVEFSQLEAGDLEVAHREFDLRVAAAEVEQQLAPLAHEKGLSFELKVDHDVPSRLLGDPGRLRQVLINLTATAIRLTSKGGVNLQVERVDEDDHGVMLRFSVAHPMPKEARRELEGLLEAFQQSAAAPSQHLSGTLLGLAISRRLVLMMGGEVGVDVGVADRGTASTLWFQLELEKHEKRMEQAVLSVSPQQKPPKPESLEGMLVMVIESSPATRKSVVESLREWGCVAIEAENSALALIQMRKAAAANKPVRLALIDKELADGGAFELARVIQGDKKLENPHLLLLAGTGQRGDAANAAAAGFKAYLMKPLPAADLHEALLAVLANATRGMAELVTRHTLAEARRSDVRVLMVEDSKVDLLVSQWALERQGYSVEVAATAAEAFDACERTRFAIVLLDLQLPDGNGYDVVAEVRKREAARGRPRTPIVAMTADINPGTREKCIAAGMDDYLSKPVDLEALCACVTRWLQSSGDAAPEAAAEHGPAPASAAPAPKPAAAPAPAKPAAAAPPRSPGPHKGRVKVVEVGDDDELAFGHISPGAQSGGELPTLDMERLEEMCMGVAKLRDQLLETFLAEIGPRLDRLAEAVSLGDAHQVEAESHGLKGMLGTIGARAGAELFSALETLSIGGDVTAAGPLLKRATIEAGRARAAIEALPFRNAA
jgi:CheY-like chemotaxis protein/HPt (histidine-containing phosphotransfer) domain-containing protein